MALAQNVTFVPATVFNDSALTNGKTVLFMDVDVCHVAELWQVSMPLSDCDYLYVLLQLHFCLYMIVQDVVCKLLRTALFCFICFYMIVLDVICKLLRTALFCLLSFCLLG